MFRLSFRGLLLCLLLGAPGVRAAAANPFDLLHRLPKEAKVDSVGGFALENVPEAPVNPFDMTAHRPPGAAHALLDAVAEPFEPASWLPRGDFLPKQFVFWALVALFGFLAFSIAANRAAVGRVWRGFLNENGLTVAQREVSGLVGNTSFFLLYASFVLNAGFFIFQLTRVFAGTTHNNFRFLLLCIFGAGALFLAKHFFVAALALLFPVAAEARRYGFLMMIFNCVLGLFLVPFNFLMAFAGEGESTRQFIAFWMLGLVAVFYAYRAGRSAIIARKFLAADQFHFLLYLCTVEIAPVLLLVKIAMRQAD